jgi:hypothetical protein
MKALQPSVQCRIRHAVMLNGRWMVASFSRFQTRPNPWRSWAGSAAAAAWLVRVVRGWDGARPAFLRNQPST